MVSWPSTTYVRYTVEPRLSGLRLTVHLVIQDRLKKLLDITRPTIFCRQECRLQECTLRVLLILARVVLIVFCFYCSTMYV